MVFDSIVVKSMKIIIFGSTGSIGQSTLEVIRSQSDKECLQVLAITGNDNIELLCKDALEFGVKRVVEDLIHLVFHK